MTMSFVRAFRNGTPAFLAGVLLLSCWNLVSAQPNTEFDRSAETRLTGAGATFPYPIYSKWFEAYKATTGIEIDYQSIGSGGGVKALMDRVVDFGASDAPLQAWQEKQMPHSVLHIPTVGGSVAVAYNLPGHISGLHLTGNVLAKIYLGRISCWNDPAIVRLNPHWKMPSIAITVIHRSEGSSATKLFTGYLQVMSPAWSTAVGSGKEVKWPLGLGAKSNDGVAAQISQNPGAIGYVELAYALTSRCQVVALRNQDGFFVMPGVGTTTVAIRGALANLKKDIKAPVINEPGKNAYPIAGLTYFLVYNDQDNVPRGKALVRFLKWTMKDGEGMAKSLDYAPLPPELIAMNNVLINSISVKP